MAVKPMNMAQEFSGLRTDSKPTDAYQGSVFIELDTGDIYMFDATSGTWIKQMSLQSE